MPQKDTLDNLRTPVCFRILSSSFTSVSIFSLSCYSIVSISVDGTTLRPIYSGWTVPLLFERSWNYTQPEFVNLLCPGIGSQPGGPVRQPYLTYRLGRLHRLAKIDSSKSIPGLLKRLQITHTGRLMAGSLKVHKIENFFDSDFGICVISLLVMHK